MRARGAARKPATSAPVPRFGARAALVLAAVVGAGCVFPAYSTGGKAPTGREVRHDEAPIPNVLVDQVGYLPELAKVATVKSAAPAPLDWQLLDDGGKPVLAGKTRPFGADRASGDAVHIVDFSSFDRPGRGYVLAVGADRSHPFDIAVDLYHRLKYDALAFFYHQRSGIAITMPYAGDAKWTRPAGHLGDSSVPCGRAAGCAYRLDVAGGWYDAGDHGKYVVNAGIAVWTLFDLYERLTAAGARGRSAADFGDGTMNIPEAGNHVPDLLDEARWEMDWMLKMQVPPGQPLAGIVHHKIHDLAWTTLALPPHLDTQPRFLHRPSTAATLNLAATAAQAARIYLPFDAPFAARCLAAAERAYAAARANPEIYAPGGQTVGGGPYDDTDVSDEFYWAAAELFITTGKDGYRADLTASPHHDEVPGARPEPGAAAPAPSPMTWQKVQALGTISLALAPAGADSVTGGHVDGRERDAARAAIRAAADVFVAAIDAEGYRTPLRAGPTGYPWGSTSDVTNDLLVIALAADFSDSAHARRYRDAVATGFGTLLGRNPLDKSFVSGYGERPLQNPHHRFWSHQYNYRYPPPPPGVLSGGPNSGLQDPTIKSAGLAGCAPAKCYLDHIESWSSNEVAINWNAPLAWVAAYLDEVARLPVVAASPASLDRRTP